MTGVLMFALGMVTSQAIYSLIVIRPFRKNRKNMESRCEAQQQLIDVQRKQIEFLEGCVFKQRVTPLVKEEGE